MAVDKSRKLACVCDCLIQFNYIHPEFCEAICWLLACHCLLHPCMHVINCPSTFLTLHSYESLWYINFTGYHIVLSYCIVGTTKVWAWPMKNINQKPASISQTMMTQYWLGPNKPSYRPECFQQVATDFKNLFNGIF